MSDPTEPTGTSDAGSSGSSDAEQLQAAPAKATRSRARKSTPRAKAAAETTEPADLGAAAQAETETAQAETEIAVTEAALAPARAPRKRTPRAVAAPAFQAPVVAPDEAAPAPRRRRGATSAPATTESVDVDGAVADLAGPDEDSAPAARTRRRRPPVVPAFIAPEPPPESDLLDEELIAQVVEDELDSAAAVSEDGEDDGTEGSGPRRRRRRGRRGRGRAVGDDDTGDEDTSTDEGSAEAGPTEEQSDDEAGTGTGSRRRRSRSGRGRGRADGDGEETGPRTREPRSEDEVRGISGSTRMEAKRQRRRDGRDTTRRRPPILTESEFLARREAVERVMVVRQQGERTQIAVLEDNVLVEHYVTRASSSSFAGNVYLGKVQNVLVSMEAAFVDIGKSRNAVLYAGEVNYDMSGLDGKPRRIEQALKSGQDVLVQVTKDPMGHKGARLTSQISLPGRYLVFVPEGSMTGISRKLPDAERTRLKSILKRIVPEDAGVIIRTAAEGASEEELTRDVARLAAQWEDIKVKAAKAKAPELVHAEPDLVLRVVRDVFNEDFAHLVVQGPEAWDTIEGYVGFVAPDLVGRLSKWEGEGDAFAAYRVDEQLHKALDRKVHLPSGGSLVIDRTEAMTVVDVNTGKFVGKGGNLEETVTKNNLEAAEEIVRQLRLRDVGGIIVIDFIDMVLESNRDLVLRRLIESLGRDRTKHNVAEVTSLGLVQMTRKRVGQGLLEAYSETCEHCNGRGYTVTVDAPEPPKKGARPPIPMPIPKAFAPKPAEPAVEDETAAEPVVAEPVVAEPVVAEPVVAEPAPGDAEPAPPAPPAPPTPVVKRSRRASSRPAAPPEAAEPAPTEA